MLLRIFDAYANSFPRSLVLGLGLRVGGLGPGAGGLGELGLFVGGALGLVGLGALKMNLRV